MRPRGATLAKIYTAVNNAFNPQRLNTLYFAKRFRPKVVDSTTCAEFVLNYFRRIIIWLLKPSLYTPWFARANSINYYTTMHILCTYDKTMQFKYKQIVHAMPLQQYLLSLSAIIDIYLTTTNLLTCLFDFR